MADVLTTQRYLQVAILAWRRCSQNGTGDRAGDRAGPTETPNHTQAHLRSQISRHTRPQSCKVSGVDTSPRKQTTALIDRDTQTQPELQGKTGYVFHGEYASNA